MEMSPSKAAYHFNCTHTYHCLLHQSLVDAITSPTKLRPPTTFVVPIRSLPLSALSPCQFLTQDGLLDLTHPRAVLISVVKFFFFVVRLAQMSNSVYLM